MPLFVRYSSYTTCTSPIMHLICLLHHPPQKNCIIFVFYFSCVLQPFQEKLKTMLVQNFFFWGGGGNKVHYERCTSGVKQLISFLLQHQLLITITEHNYTTYYNYTSRAAYNSLRQMANVGNFGLADNKNFKRTVLLTTVYDEFPVDH